MAKKKPSKFQSRLQAGRKPTKRRTEPLWKLEDGITYSGLSTWINCPEQFSLQWIDGLTPKGVSIPLEFGSTMHYGLEHQWKGDPKYVIHTITEQYRKHKEKSLRNSADRDTLNYILGLAEVTFPPYCEFWRQDDLAINWIGREEKFSVKHTIQNKNGPREITLRGMRDGIYQHGNVLGIFETKTKTKIVQQEIEDLLQSDMQTLIYAYCTYLQTGSYPNRVKYNVIRRADLYRRKGENTQDYLQRVAEDIKVRPEHYFHRFTVHITPDNINNFVKKTLDPILALFVEWWDGVKKNPVGEGRWEYPFHYQNSTALVGKFGKVAMWDAIFGRTQSYLVRDQIFPELEDCFQVTWEETKAKEDIILVPEDF